MARPPADDYQAKVKKAQEAKNAVMKEIDLAEKRQKQEESAVRQAANQARKDRWVAQRKEAWDGQGGVADLAKRMKKEGAKGYDTWAAAMGSVVELALAMAEALHAELRPQDRLLDATSLIAGVGWQGLKLGVGVLFRPGQAASNVTEFIRSFTKKGATLELSDEMLKTSTCDATGKISFDSAKDLMPSTTSPDMVKHIDDLNQSMQKAFLASQGYKEVAPNTFHDASGKPLTSAMFEALKKDPDQGLKAFAKREHRVNLEEAPPEVHDTSSARMRR